MRSTIPKQQWLDWLNEQEQSDLSIAAFCRSKEISADNFYYHRKKAQQKPHADAPGFVRAKLPQLSRQSSLTLTRGQTTLLFPCNTSPQWLAALMMALA